MILHMFFTRTLFETLERASRTFPAVLVTGPRQVGKTTLLEQAAESGRTRVTLDDPIIRELACRDPALFFQRFQPPLLIDEVQYAPQLFPHIKMTVDRERQNGLFWMTGSQQFHLMRGVTESLAGRVAILQLQGLSQAEKCDTPQRPPFMPGNTPATSRSLSLRDVYRLIQLGSFPALHANPEVDAQTFYASYVRTYLARDVSDVLRVSDTMRFLRFMKIAAARTGQLLNCADMARDAEVSPNTLKSWLSVLEASGIIHLLPPWHANLATRLVKMPKLYFLDTGLCCHLTGWNNPEVLESGAMGGAFLETYVVSEILKSHWHHGRAVSLCFYRDKEKREIDLLLESNGLLHPIEIKKTASPAPSDVRVFDYLRTRGHPMGPGALICFSPHHFPLSRGVDCVPVGGL